MASQMSPEDDDMPELGSCPDLMDTHEDFAAINLDSIEEDVDYPHIIGLDSVVVAGPPPTANARQQLKDIRKKALVETTYCIFSHWRSRVSSNPQLAALAEVILALPVTQVVVEREFSNLPLILTDRRSRLSVVSVENIVNVKLYGFQKPK